MNNDPRLAKCNKCGTLAGWAVSKKTGKPYLAQAISYGNDWKVLPYKPHFKVCGQPTYWDQRRAEWAARDEAAAKAQD